MEAFLEYVIKQLVEFPDELAVARREEGRRVTYYLKMRQSDVGKVIGKNGHTIAAIRALVASGAARHGQKGFVEIVEPKRHHPPAHHHTQAAE